MNVEQVVRDAIGQRLSAEVRAAVELEAKALLTVDAQSAGYLVRVSHTPLSLMIRDAVHQVARGMVAAELGLHGDEPGRCQFCGMLGLVKLEPTP